MNKSKEDFQQQILFDEGNVEQTIVEHHVEHQVVVNNEDWQPVEEEYIEAVDTGIEEKSKPKWLWRIVAALISLILVIEAVDFLASGFTNSPIITSLYAAVFLCISFITSMGVVREFVGLRQLKYQQVRKKQAYELQHQNKGNAAGFCQKITQQLSCDLSEEQKLKWQTAVDKGYDNAELMELYSQQVLSQVDQKALDEIAKYSSESVVLIALSPIALLDMMIMFWRNIKLIDKVAGLYGLKLGYWSRLKLIKQVFINMAYAGASELIADFGADMLGADLLGKLSGRLAQGLGAGLLTARLGLKTLEVCRPIAFTKSAPQLKHVRKAVIGQVKRLVKAK